MEEIANLLNNYGTTFIIVVLFLWDWVSNRKDMKNSLEEMAKTNNNTAKSLELLQKSMENQEKIISNIEKANCEILEKVKEMENSRR